MTLYLCAAGRKGTYFPIVVCKKKQAATRWRDKSKKLYPSHELKIFRLAADDIHDQER